MKRNTHTLKFMGPAHLKFGGGVSESIFNPLVLAVVLVAGILICVWPRHKALAAFLAAAILIPVDQVLLLGGMHFPMLRVLLLFGFVRMLKEKFYSKRRVFSGGMNKIDAAVILLSLVTAINAVLLFPEMASAINQAGILFTVFGIYFLLRSLIREEQDITHAIRTLAGIAAIVAAIMTYEFATGHNPYALLGGARASFYANLVQRDDRFRAQAGFSHSLLAGTFGAVLMPLFLALWWKGKEHRAIVALGIVSSTLIMLTANGSTPVLAYAAGVLGLCLWPLRDRMRAIRWSIVGTLVALHLVMKAPVWHLISRIDISGGSSGYHRYMLIDQCIRHFGDWWLIGVKDTSVWGWDMWDTANQYVGLCDGSGLLPFLLFLAILVYGFRFLGKARRRFQKDHRAALFVWAIGAALFANVVAFFGISYWDQTQVVWYGLLAMISTAALCPKKDAQSAPIPNLAETDRALGASEQFAPELWKGNEPPAELVTWLRNRTTRL